MQLLQILCFVPQKYSALYLKICLGFLLGQKQNYFFNYLIKVQFYTLSPSEYFFIFVQ